MGRIVGMENITRYLGMSESTVMDNIHHNDLPAKKVSGIWEVDQAALDRWRLPKKDEKRSGSEKKTTQAKPRQGRSRRTRKGKK